MKTMLRTAVITAALALPLTACSASGASSFSTVEELKAAYVDAGGACDEWDVGDAIGAWAQFGNCEPSAAVLSTYSSKDDLNETLADLKSRKQHNPRAFVGPNWIITTDADESVGLAMKATIVNLDDFE